MPGARQLSAALLLGELAERLSKIDFEAVEKLLVVGPALREQFLSRGLGALLLKGVSSGASFSKLILHVGLLGLYPSPVLAVEIRCPAD